MRNYSFVKPVKHFFTFGCVWNLWPVHSAANYRDTLWSTNWCRIRRKMLLRSIHIEIAQFKLRPSCAEMLQRISSNNCWNSFSKTTASFGKLPSIKNLVFSKLDRPVVRNNLSDIGEYVTVLNKYCSMIILSFWNNALIQSLSSISQVERRIWSASHRKFIWTKQLDLKIKNIFCCHTFWLFLSFHRNQFQF